MKISSHKVIENQLEYLKKESVESARGKRDLEALQACLEGLTSGMWEGVVVIDRGFRIRNVNHQFLKEHSTTREQVIGRACHEVTHGCHKPCAMGNHVCPATEVFSTGRPVKVEHFHADRKGEQLIVEIYAFPLFNGNGNVEQVVKVSHDITRRRRAEQSLRRAHEDMQERLRQRTAGLRVANERLKMEIMERRQAEQALRRSEQGFRDLVDNSLVGIYKSNLEGKFVYVNRALAEILEFDSPEEMMSEGVLARYKFPEDRKVLIERLEESGRVANFELEQLTKKGDTRHTLLCATLEGDTICGMIMDVTERNRMEKALAQANTELKNFVDIVVHDLRNPIIGIVAACTILLKSDGVALPEKRRGMLSHIADTARQMDGLVADLRALSMVGQVAPNLQNVDLTEIVNKVVSNLRSVLDKKGITLVTADALPAVRCDGQKMYQVFDNLVANAIRYRNPKKKPVIEIGYTDQRHTHRFYVKDNGIGIKPEYHRKIFEMFHRGGKGRDKDASGIGLAIVERVVRQHGGEAWVESEQDKGSVFYFTLPKQ